GIAQGFPDPRHGEDRSNAYERVAGADQNGSRLPQGLESAGGRVGSFRSAVGEARHARLAFPADEIFLEWQNSFVRVNLSRDGTVRHRKKRGADLVGQADPMRDFVQTLPPDQGRVAVSKRRQSAVANEKRD